MVRELLMHVLQHSICSTSEWSEVFGSQTLDHKTNEGLTDQLPALTYEFGWLPRAWVAADARHSTETCMIFWAVPQVQTCAICTLTANEGPAL